MFGDRELEGWILKGYKNLQALCKPPNTLVHQVALYLEGWVSLPVKPGYVLLYGNLIFLSSFINHSEAKPGPPQLEKLASLLRALSLPCCCEV